MLLPKGKHKNMINVGHYNVLNVVSEFPFGYQLMHKDDDRSVVLSEKPAQALSENAEVEVFVYTDENGQLVATQSKVKIQAGQVKVLKAVGVTNFGAFFDWGLPKDLFVPVQHQSSPIDQGMCYPVYLGYDELTQRLTATTKLHNVLSEDGSYLNTSDKVDLIVYGKTPLGVKVVINETHLGLIFASDAFKTFNIGDQTTGYIKQVREDGKIDVVLQQVNATARDALQQAILDDLEAHGGLSTLTDKSPKEEIYAHFNVSKAAYKRALGALYKQNKIDIDKSKITLL